ncbi:two-component system, OmpR family, response regulator [Schaalia meyeri]|nr:two-component system, OmpR family, response regulator [Schaalia meyeri]
MTCFILAYDPGIPRKRANAPIRSVPKLTIATSILPPNSQKTYRNIRDTEAMANTGTEAKLLVVDDEPNIRDLLASSLRFAGFDVVTAEDGGGAFHEAQASRPDLIVLDVMLPDMDGFTVTRRLRDAGVTTPVLFLTARDDMRDKIQGLTVGGDDYVTKPFGLEEVVARIRAILRRTMGMEEDDALLRVGDLVIDEDAHEVTRAGVQIDLSPTEFKLLRYLVINAGRVVSKMQILDHVWEYDWDGEVAIVESYISYLRRKLAVDGASGELIHTKRGVGYILRVED